MKETKRELKEEEKNEMLRLLNNHPNVVFKAIEKAIGSSSIAAVWLYDELFFQPGNEKAEIKKAPETAKKELEEIVTQYLNEFGVLRRIKGFYYLRTAICICIEEPKKLYSMTKLLYPAVAEIYKTTSDSVERAIRYAIELTWSKGRPEKLEEIFGYTISADRKNPTNTEFITLLAEKISHEIR